MSECKRVQEIVDSRSVDETHVVGCADCSNALSVHGFFQTLAAADDLSPSLPDPRMLVLKAELMRQRNELRAEDDATRWTGVAIWTAIAAIWLTLLTWKISEIQSLLEKFNLVPAIPGGAAATAVLVAVGGGLVAFTVFAVAVHSVLAEL